MRTDMWYNPYSFQALRLHQHTLVRKSENTMLSLGYYEPRAIQKYDLPHIR